MFYYPQLSLHGRGHLLSVRAILLYVPSVTSLKTTKNPEKTACIHTYVNVSIDFCLASVEATRLLPYQ